MAPVQPSASVVATGTGIRYIGTDPTYCYSYSGKVSSAGPPTTILGPFTTGSGFIRAEVHFSYTAAGGGLTGDDYEWIIYLNDIIIQSLVTTSQADHRPRPIIIPPFTKVEIKSDNKSQDVAHDCYAVLTGRVYGAE